MARRIAKEAIAIPRVFPGKVRNNSSDDGDEDSKGSYRDTNDVCFGKAVTPGWRLCLDGSR